MPPQSTQDPPLGFPYNTGDGPGGGAATAMVPLRDFLSSRQDQQRAELIERIESLSRQLRDIIDERDRQYAQRFAAQQDAVTAALGAAKEAVTKAEAAAEKRFDSVNEFRATLVDQAQNFMHKNTADAHFAGLEEKVNSVLVRINRMEDRGQGSAETWGWIVGLAGLAMVVVAFLYNARAGGGRAEDIRAADIRAMIAAEEMRVQMDNLRRRGSDG